MKEEIITDLEKIKEFYNNSNFKSNIDKDIKMLDKFLKNGKVLFPEDGNQLIQVVSYEMLLEDKNGKETNMFLLIFICLTKSNSRSIFKKNNDYSVGIEKIIITENPKAFEMYSARAKNDSLSYNEFNIKDELKS